jgi:hypothetical protein
VVYGIKFYLNLLYFHNFLRIESLNSMHFTKQSLINQINILTEEINKMETSWRRKVTTQVQK